jgi:hypothetical protein
MSSGKFKKALAEAKSTAPARVAIPQVDPGESTPPVAAAQQRTRYQFHRQPPHPAMTAPRLRELIPAIYR